MAHVLGICGYSGSGKTTLIEALLPWFNGQGVRVSVLKHSHHDVQLEAPSKDSARFRAAGASEVLLASPYRYALIHELRNEAEPALAELLASLRPVDLVLVEGFKREAIPRIEIYRPAVGKAPLFREDSGIIAVASDVVFDLPIPCLDLNSPAAVGRFIVQTLSLPVES